MGLALPLVLLLAASPQTLTFDDARRLAEASAPDVLLAAARIDSAEGDVGIAGALTNPTFSIATATQSARLGLAVSLPIPLLWGRRATAVLAAEADRRVVELDFEVIRRDARRAATLAWVDAWEAAEESQLLATAATDAQRVLEVARAKLEAGTGAKVDFIRTRADTARATSEAEASRHQTLAFYARLATLLGIDGPVAIRGAPAEPGPARGPHPALTRARQLITAADAHLTAERRQRFPELTLQLGVNQFDPGYVGQEFVVGLAFELPVLDWRNGAVNKAIAAQRIAELALTQETLRLRAEATGAAERAAAANVLRVSLQTQVLPDLEEARALAEEGYQLGRLELLRVLEAQRALLDARLSQTHATANWVRAMSDLEGAADAP